MSKTFQESQEAGGCEACCVCDAVEWEKSNEKRRLEGQGVDIYGRGPSDAVLDRRSKARSPCFLRYFIATSRKQITLGRDATILHLSGVRKMEIWLGCVERSN